MSSLWKRLPTRLGDAIAPAQSHEQRLLIDADQSLEWPRQADDERQLLFRVVGRLP
jgi:hypothetical protein